MKNHINEHQMYIRASDKKKNMKWMYEPWINRWTSGEYNISKEQQINEQKSNEDMKMNIWNVGCVYEFQMNIWASDEYMSTKWIYEECWISNENIIIRITD